jgi:hypothetical protein
MTSKKQTGWPVPLRDRDIGLGNAVREYARNTEAAGDEPAAYERMLKGLAGRPRRAPMLMLGFGLGAATVLVTMVVLHRDGAAPAPKEIAVAPAPPTPAPSVRKAIETPPAPAPVPRQAIETPRAPTPRPPVPTIRLAAADSVLPSGKVELLDEASAVVSADAVASGRNQAGRTEISLAKGSIALHVLPRAPGHEFAVSAGDYRFMVVGTAFTVSQDQARLQLMVSEGKVAVWRGSDRLVTVGAGEQWSTPLSPAVPPRARAARVPAESSPTVAMRDPVRPAPAPAPARVPAANVQAEAPTTPPPLVPTPPSPEPAAQPAPAVRRDCGAVASRSPQEALGCYQQQAAQGGLAGESAQYEIARLWRDSFHDSSRALAAYREQRSRFPRGVLAIEADLSIIELLPRLDRHAEALSESERFLREHPGAERRGEIHLLRGNIFREAMRDFAHAEHEYALGSETRGRAGDENRFLRAVCLEALGRTQEARVAYGHYLSQPKSAHAQEAKTRLERLGP